MIQKTLFDGVVIPETGIKSPTSARFRNKVNRNLKKPKETLKTTENCDKLDSMLQKLEAKRKMVNGNKKKKLIFAHQNLRGGDVSTNDDDNQKSVGVDQILSNVMPDVLGISETQVSDTQRSLKQGYNWEIKEDSPPISVLVNSSLNYRRRKDLEFNNFATIWVELSPQASNPILVCNLYREWGILQPGSRRIIQGSRDKSEQKERWQKFIAIWKRIVQSGQEFHVLGDCNMDRNKWRQIIVEDGNQADDSDSGYDSEEKQGGQDQG